MAFTLAYVLFSLLALWIIQEFVLPARMSQAQEIPYSEFKGRVRDGRVVQVTLDSSLISGEMRTPTPTAMSDPNQTSPFNTVAPASGDPKLLDELDAAGVTYRIKPPASPVADLVLSWLLPLVILTAFWYTVYRRARTAAGGVFGVGRSKATAVTAADVGVTYQDGEASWKSSKAEFDQIRDALVIPQDPVEPVR